MVCAGAATLKGKTCPSTFAGRKKHLSMIAVRCATSTIPIVMVGIGDPVSSGLIASLARPGGNITGLSIISVDLSAKLMELFAELVPGMKRVGVVRNPNNPA